MNIGKILYLVPCLRMSLKESIRIIKNTIVLYDRSVLDEYIRAFPFKGKPLKIRNRDRAMCERTFVLPILVSVKPCALHK
jgi:hypothetical protein